MGHFDKNAKWHDKIYQIERTDPVVGGEGGISNQAPMELADRTEWLKQQIELQQCNSIAELRTIEPTQDNQMIYVKGYYPNSTKGSGYFVADLADTASANNDGTVIVTNSGKRWLRVYDGLSLYDFGYAVQLQNAGELLLKINELSFNVPIDCLGLAIDIGGAVYPTHNIYTNGQVIINGAVRNLSHNLLRTGNGRILIGDNAGGSINTYEKKDAGIIAVGRNALGQCTSAFVSVAIGNNAMANTLLSRDNIAIGEGALQNVQADTANYDQSRMNGTRNIAIGGLAGLFCNKAQGNVMIGRNAAEAVTNGNDNVVIGRNAGIGTVPVGFSGEVENIYPSLMSSSVVVGANALTRYTASSAVTVIGANALQYAKNASEITAVGRYSLGNLQKNKAPNGGDVLWEGTLKGTYVQSGQDITLSFADNHGAEIGYTIGLRLLSGESKTFQNDIIPAVVTKINGNDLTVQSSIFKDTTGEAELKYVYTEISSQEESKCITAIGSYSGNNLEQAQHVVAAGNAVLANTKTATKVVALGDDALRNGNHTNSVAIGYNTGRNVNTNQCVFIGESAGYRWQNGEIASGNINNSVAIGAMSRVAGDNEVQIGMWKQTVYASSGIQVRSDLRDKTDIKPLELGLDFIEALTPISGVWDKRDAYVDDLFTDLPDEERQLKLAQWWRSPEKDGRFKESKRHFWLGAQDLKSLESQFGDLPMVVHQNQNGADTYTVCYEEFVPILVKAVQELSHKINILEQKESAL